MKKIKVRQLPVQCRMLSDGTQFYDFGKDAFAVLELKAQVAEAQDVTLAVGEVQREGQIERSPGGSRIYQEERVTLTPGKQQYFMTMVHPGYNGGTLPIEPNVAPFRYAEVRGLRGQAEVIQHAYFGEFEDDASEFHSDSETLNRIWEFCKYTMKATTPFGLFIDGNRERQAYEGDTYINQLSYLVCTCKKDMSRRTIERLFTYPTWPTEWQLSMIPILHDYLLYTGDLELVKDYYEALKGKLLLDCVNGDGLLCVAGAPSAWTCPGFDASVKISDIVDWPVGERDGYEMGEVNLVPNCWQCMALCRMAELADSLGHEDEAKQYRQQAAERRAAIRKTMLKNGLFVDNPDSEHTALHSDIFPLLWGLADDDEKPVMLRHLQSRGMACSVFGAQFLLECCYVNRLADYGLQLMTSEGKRSWCNMLAQGATITMEAWDDSFKPNQDWNHPWGAAPGNIIVRHLAGIRPVKPGFKRFVVDPQPGTLRHFRLRTPTPMGDINLSYQVGEGYELTVPEGTQALYHDQLLEAGVYHLKL